MTDTWSNAGFPGFPCRGHRKWGCTQMFYSIGAQCGDCQTKQHEEWERQRGERDE